MHADLRYVRFEGAPGPRHRVVGPGTAAHGGGTPVPPRPRPVQPAALASLVLTRAGLDVRSYRPAPLDRRVAACLRALRAGSERAARAALDQQPSLVSPALDTFIIGVSAFFRDAPVFDALRTRIVPALAARGAAPRVLSVGCSGGAELFSMGMLLGDSGLLERAELVGIDCRCRAVAQAARGMFTDAETTGVDSASRCRYFERLGEGWRVTARLRQQTRWIAADATRQVPSGPWDVVLCRNLAIYLELPASHALFARLTSVLTPGGVLVLGKAERPPAGLPLRPMTRCVYQKAPFES